MLDFRVLFGSQSYSLIGSSRFDLPWQITGIQVVFNENVSASAASLNGTGFTVGGLSGSGTTMLTWTFAAPLALGSFSASLATSGTNAITDASHIALTGANTSENFQVLSGDFNGDGVVTSADMVGINRAIGSVYNIFADLDGNGTVDMNDVLIARGQNGKSLAKT